MKINQTCCADEVIRAIVYTTKSIGVNCYTCKKWATELQNVRHFMIF